ncbi:MAG: DNA-binding protein [Bacteroidia bacterium]|nr:DNA-binding protein [Bacteroidia bacterium]
MANVLVERYQRHLKIGDKTSPMMYFLKPKPKNSRTYSIEDLAKEIEVTGALSAEDVMHVMKSFMRAMKRVLIEGNKVKVDKLGLFFTTFSCKGVKDKEECTVKNIKRVNLRFMVDNSLRLTNDSVATTRGGENNVTYALDTSESGKSETPVKPNKPNDDEAPDPKN